MSSSLLKIAADFLIKKINLLFAFHFVKYTIQFQLIHMQSGGLKSMSNLGTGDANGNKK